jgi:hypothetical protein
MIQRFARDESGMTIGLAMIIVLIIGVMGAGLLTFANTNLNTVLEANQGQRAFEVADAGIEAARRQLASDCIGNNTCMIHYNPVFGDDNLIQWSLAEGGLTLNNLDGIATTADSAHVTIEYVAVAGELNEYKVISTGTYGDSRRKIEATFKPITAGGGGGGNVINPAYYTPSDIRLWSTGSPNGGVEVKGMNLFSEGNIIIEGITSAEGTEATSFQREYERSNDADMLTVTNGNRVLEDWNSLNYDPPGSWNTIGRLDRSNRFFDGVGFGALGLICGGTPSTDPTDCDDPSDSIAEGRYGYDSTTGPINGLTGATQTPKGQGLTFFDKQPTVDPDTGTTTWGPNDPGTITFPFERRTVPPDRLKGIAMDSGTWYRGQNPDWNTLLSGDRSRIIFIDAEGEEITLEGGGGTKKGIIVVWCGTLNMNDVGSFQGIILTLNGQGEELRPDDPETGELSSSCGAEQGRFEVTDSDLKTWFYAEAEDDPNTPTVVEAGVELGPGTQIDFLPSGSWQLLDILFEDAIPTSFEAQGWRELYQ